MIRSTEHLSEQSDAMLDQLGQSLGEPNLLHDVLNKGPSKHVISFSEVNLDHKISLLVADLKQGMQHLLATIMFSCILLPGTNPAPSLIQRDNPRDERLKAIHHHLCQDFVTHVAQQNGPELVDKFLFRDLRNQANVCVVVLTNTFRVRLYLLHKLIN